VVGGYLPLDLCNVIFFVIDRVRSTKRYWKRRPIKRFRAPNKIINIRFVFFARVIDNRINITMYNVIRRDRADAVYVSVGGIGFSDVIDDGRRRRFG